ncbi:hypothetical protein PhCBS80983_g05077 [Powellomyces hirtus]|uniref:PAS domain-containing protein n=1 Tax=Powellomyces hirtus TaxID=109895 RepID=A0A507DX21_9FUNG|nr:hypothetical protein PhCBS80983_g05077 [Powellomyces hirtus]
MHILASVVSRPNPTINLGPIDMSSSFIVTSATDADFPILYASQTFEQLTGYETAEIVGKNCRFLQSPDGIVQRGALRQFVDNNIVYQLKTSVDQQMECQFININYKKGGEPFVNLITIIPICNGRGTPPQFFVGFQVDLMKQAGVILRMLEDHTYVIDFAKSPNHQQQQQSQGTARADTPPLLLADCAPPCGYFEQEVQNQVGAPLATAAGAAAAGEDDDDLFQSLMMTTLPHQQHDRHQRREQQQQQELFARLNSTADYMRTDVMNLGGVGVGERATGILPAEECTRHDDDDDDDNDDNLRAAFASAIDHPAPPLSTATHILTPPTSTASSTTACSSSSTPTATPPDPISHYDLIQASPDFIHILSSRGIILFASPSSILTQTGYEPGDLLGHTIAEFCHPADTMLLMREIKQSTLEQPVSAAYRFRKRDGSGYVSWDVTGHKYEMATRKKTRCVVLSARERRWGDIKQSTLIPSLSPCSPPTRASTLAPSPPTTTPLGGTLPRALWCKITSTGLFIYVPPSSYPVFGSLTAPPSLYGRQLLDFVYEGDRARVAAQLFRNDDPCSGDTQNTHETSANTRMMMTKEIRCSIESAGRFVPALLAAHPSGAGDFMFLCVTLVGSFTPRGGVTAVGGGGGEPSRPESSPTSPSAQPPPTAPNAIHHQPTSDTTPHDPPASERRYRQQQQRPLNPQ